MLPRDRPAQFFPFVTHLLAQLRTLAAHRAERRHAVAAALEAAATDERATAGTAAQQTEVWTGQIHVFLIGVPPLSYHSSLVHKFAPAHNPLTVLTWLSLPLSSVITFFRFRLKLLPPLPPPFPLSPSHFPQGDANNAPTAQPRKLPPGFAPFNERACAEAIAAMERILRVRRTAVRVPFSLL